MTNVKWGLDDLLDHVTNYATLMWEWINCIKHEKLHFVEGSFVNILTMMMDLSLEWFLQNVQEIVLKVFGLKLKHFLCATECQTHKWPWHQETTYQNIQFLHHKYSLISFSVEAFNQTCFVRIHAYQWQYTV